MPCLPFTVLTVFWKGSRGPVTRLPMALHYPCSLRIACNVIQNEQDAQPTAEDIVYRVISLAPYDKK